MKNPVSEKGMPPSSSKGDDTTPMERRRQKRFQGKDGAYAALVRQDHALDLGKIVDISSGGACISYLATGEPGKAKGEIKIFDMNGRFVDLGRIQCDIIYDVNVDEREWNAIATRRCGVRFVDLTPRHLLMLENFIQDATVGEV